MVTTHLLKLHSQFVAEYVSGRKTFELRKNDRNFKIGDRLVLSQWIPELERYTGVTIIREIVGILKGPYAGLEEGYVILSLE